MSTAPVQTLHTAVGPIEVELVADIADDPAGSIEALKGWAASIRFAAAMSVYSRVMMGRQLLRIQELALWQRFDIRTSDGTPVEIKTWSGFMGRGFRNISGLSRETGYHATQLAGCRTISSLPPSELCRFENLSNAVLLARLEREQGPHVAAGFLQPAMTLSVEDFRALAGKGKRATMEVLLEDPAVADPLGRIVNWFKLASPDALEAFWEVMERAKLYGGDNPNDSLDAIMAACYFQWGQEEGAGVECFKTMSSS